MLYISALLIIYSNIMYWRYIFTLKTTVQYTARNISNFLVIYIKNKKADTVYTVSANPWCRRWDLNPHGVTRLILSQVRLPFRHSGSSMILVYTGAEKLSIFFYPSIILKTQIILAFIFLIVSLKIYLFHKSHKNLQTL